MNSVKVNEKLYLEKSFFDFVANTNNIICSMILNLETLDGINYISSSNKPDMISFLPKSKIKSIIDDPFTDSGRCYLRIGRLASKLFSNALIKKFINNDSHIENFVNQYKSWFDLSNSDIRVIQGEDIRKYYLDRNYLTLSGNPIGKLWTSCMRYQERQKLLDLYCVNDNIKMLVMIVNINGEEKVRSRALLWEDVETVDSSFKDIGTKIKIMDRIYSVFDSDIITFKKWAIDNGYLPKYDQNSKTHQIFDVGGLPLKISLKVKLKRSSFKLYPYLDTFPYFDMCNGKLYNDELVRNWEYKLVQANGNLTSESEEELYDQDYTDDF